MTYRIFESDFSFDSDSDINFSDCSSSSDESDHDSINLQSVRQWCKIDIKNIPPPPPSVPFHENPGITVNVANNASILNHFELFFDDQILRMIVKKPIDTLNNISIKQFVKRDHADKNGRKQMLKN
ncbi:hypothetical protein TNCV_2865781 [Trichonephila clavipes]|nr:hypothetical protein TNCV_2865781 [Trichonephila clavipes]